jgi:molecular chaperone GrpE
MSTDTTESTTTTESDENPDDTAAAESGGTETLLQKAQADAERFKDHALRTQADFENFRKRAAREREDAVKYANASFLERLIPILDNFDLGLTAARSNAADSPILAGMDMVSRQLNDFLVSSGVEPVSGEGQKFDPNLHEAVAQEESATVAEGVVIRQLRKGYKLRERLLRPATVVVSKGPAA